VFRDTHIFSITYGILSHFYAKFSLDATCDASLKHAEASQFNVHQVQAGALQDNGIPFLTGPSINDGLHLLYGGMGNFTGYLAALVLLCLLHAVFYSRRYCRISFQCLHHTLAGPRQGAPFVG
jgi:hypothetical protein